MATTEKLSRLLKEIDVVEIIGETDKNITSLQSDSRKAEKDGLFVAVKGVTTDGHKYIPVVASARRRHRHQRKDNHGYASL